MSESRTTNCGICGAPDGAYHIPGCSYSPLGFSRGSTVIKDSGKRQQFDTGAVRDTSEGKGRYDLLPPQGIREVAQHFEAGAKKYADRNWEKGMPLARFLDSGIRHAFMALEGRDDENHAAAAAWNLLCFIETRARIKAGVLPASLDNLPKHYSPKLIEDG